ncbi:hypothetical protein ACQPXT_13550 [Streptomyces sp. CA-100214]
MDVRDEFRAGWREGLERGGAADEARRFGAWLLHLPGAAARFLAGQLRALWTLSVSFLHDALRGTPVLIGILVQAIGRGARAVARGSAGAGVAAPAPAAKPEPKPSAPAAEDEGQEQAEEEAQHTDQAPAGPLWKKRRKAPAKAAPAAQVPAAAPAGKNLGDLAETAGIAFLVLVLVVTFGGMLLGYLGSLLAPYASGIVLGAVVAWSVAAAIVAPRPGVAEPVDEDQDDEDEESHTENDHEEPAGEEGQETDPWPAQRAAIRAFVEAEVAAGNAGHRDAKGKGAPVDQLLAELQSRGSAQGWERNAMLDLLDRAGITVRQQMKFRIGGKQKTPPVCTSTT